MRILSSASTGTGKSATASRLTCRPSVSTSGRGPVYSADPKPAPAAREPAVAGMAVALTRRAHARLQDHGEAGATAGRHPDDVAGAQLRQRPARLRPAGSSHGPGTDQPRVRVKIVSRPHTRRSRRGDRSSTRPVRQGLVVPADLPGQARPRRGRPGTGRTTTRAARGRGPPGRSADQVDGHVVRRAGSSSAADRCGCEARPATAPRVEARLPQHDRVALDVDAAPAGPAGELGVLPRR